MTYIMDQFLFKKNFQAENLLKSEPKKWKCDSWCQQSSVLIQV